MTGHNEVLVGRDGPCLRDLSCRESFQIGLWERAHMWKGGCLPPLCDFLVLELFIIKLTLPFWPAAPLVKASKHPHKKARNSLNILKSSF